MKTPLRYKIYRTERWVSSIAGARRHCQRSTRHGMRNTQLFSFLTQLRIPGKVKGLLPSANVGWVFLRTPQNFFRSPQVTSWFDAGAEISEEPAKQHYYYFFFFSFPYADDGYYTSWPIRGYSCNQIHIPKFRKYDAWRNRVNYTGMWSITV